jgi:hypothetical protein
LISFVPYLLFRSNIQNIKTGSSFKKIDSTPLTIMILELSDYRINQVGNSRMLEQRFQGY